VLISVIPNNIPINQINSSNDLINWIQYREINITSNITALGTIISGKINSEEVRYDNINFSFTVQSRY
jgi:hypothetical protein